MMKTILNKFNHLFTPIKIVKIIYTATYCTLPLLWLLLVRNTYSPWWLENALATPYILIIVFILFTLLGIAFLRLITITVTLIFCLLTVYFQESVPNENVQCSPFVRVLQFNTKYDEEHVTNLISQLNLHKYDLVTLYEISPKVREILINKLRSTYPFLIEGVLFKKGLQTDQLILSRHELTHMSYLKNNHASFTISAMWNVKGNLIKLYSLHPPSPRTNKLWERRNQAFHQLNYKMKNDNKTIVIGDFNLSKHSARLKDVVRQMNTIHVTSWPKLPFIPSPIGLSIDHLYTSNHFKVCSREQLLSLDYSDHYPIRSHIILDSGSRR